MSSVLRSKFLHFLKKRRGDILACLVIALFVFLVGIKLGAWTGDLKGDDAYFHVARVQYILNNFPHLNWYQQSFAGYDPFGFEPPFLYFIVAAAKMVTGLSIITLFQIILCISMISVGLAIYFLCRCLKIPRLLGMGFSLLIFSIPEIWNWLVIGGAYLRIPALAFFFLSFGLVYVHLKEIRRGTEHLGLYIGVVVTLAIMAMLQPIVFQWASLILLAAYFFGVSRWRQKAYYIAKIFIPVACLAAWTYLPLFTSYFKELSSPTGTGSSQYVTPLELHWLFTVPSPHVWSNSLGPLVFPTALFFFFIALLTLLRQKVIGNIQPRLLFAIIMGVFSLYFFAFGWLHLPAKLYMMASYDYCIFLGFSLVLFSIFTISILLETRIFSWYRDRQGLAVSIAVLVIILLGNAASIPFLKAYTSDQNPFNPRSLAYATRQIVTLARNSRLKGYRLANAQRRWQSWLPFSDPDILTTGGRSKNDAPHKYYNQWADFTINYRLDITELQSLYADDAPQVIRGTLAGDQNYYSSMFWLDWYGASGSIIMPSIYLQEETALGYANRPQFFEQFESNTSFGDAYFYKYLDSSPITVSTNTPVVAVPFQSGDAPQFYTDVLQILSSMNLDSQWLIPVKMDGTQNLEHFDIALVDYQDYTENKTVLNSFVENGGRLIVTGATNSKINNVMAQMPSLGLSFSVNGSILQAPGESNILATAQEGPLVYETALGRGKLVIMGITLNDLIQSDSIDATILLAQLVDPQLKINNIGAEIESSRISFITNGTIAAISYPDGNSSIPSLTFIPDSNITDNQVNWSLPLPEELAADSNSIVNFSLWSDGNSPSSIAVTLEQSGKGYLYYNLPDQVWNGWKDFTLPLSYFQWKEGPQVSNFDSVVIDINDDSPYPSNSGVEQFKIQNVNVMNLTNISSYTSLDGKWEQANKFVLPIGNNNGILWKESYFPSWTIKDNLGRKIDYYFAGPGMIYLIPQQGATSLTFEIPVPKILIAGYVISGIALFGFATYIILKSRKARAKKYSP